MTPTTDVIHFTCHACGMVLTVPKDLAGISGPCPQCQAIITSPSFIETIKPVLSQHVVEAKPVPVPSPPSVAHPSPRQLPAVEAAAPQKPVPQTSPSPSPWAPAPLLNIPAEAPVVSPPVPTSSRIPALHQPPPQANFPIPPKDADSVKRQATAPSSSFSGNLPVAVPRPLPEPRLIIPPVVAAPAPLPSPVEDLQAVPPQIKAVEAPPVISPTVHKTAVVLPRVQTFQLPQPRKEEPTPPVAGFPSAPVHENLPEPQPILESDSQGAPPKPALTTLPPKGASTVLPSPHTETSESLTGDQVDVKERPLPQWSTLSAAEKRAFGRPPSRGASESPKKWGVFILALAMLLLVLACTAFFFQDSLKMAWSQYQLSKEPAVEADQEEAVNVPPAPAAPSNVPAPSSVVPQAQENPSAQTSPPPVVEVPVSMPPAAPDIPAPDLSKPEVAPPASVTPSPAPVSVPDAAKPAPQASPPAVPAPAPPPPAVESVPASDLPKPMPPSPGMAEVSISEPASTVLPAQLVAAASTSPSAMANVLEEPRETMVEVPAAVPEPAKVDKAEEEYRIIVEAPPEVNAAVDVLKEFCAAATWQERAKYVQFDHQMRPLMERYYEANPYSPLRLSYISLIRHDQSTTAGAVPHCVFEISGSGLKQPTPVMIELTAQGWKVDWLTFTEFKDELLQRFMEDFVEAPARFRVLIQRAHFFGSQTLKTSDMEGKNYFRVQSPIPGFSGHVFVPKSSEIVRELDANLGWNVKNAPVVVELQWRKEGGLQWVELVSVPQYNWRNPGPQVAKAEAVDDGPKKPSSKRASKK